MRTLDKYTIREFIPPFIYCITIFIFLYVIIDLFGHLDDILKQEVSVSILYNYYLSFVPIIFVQTAPIAVLLSTIYILGKLNKHNEIVAMRANGISLIQILRPFVCLGFILSIFVFLVNDKIVPRASIISTTIKEQNIEKAKAASKNKIINNVTIYGSKNRLFFVGSFDVSKKILNDITILEHDEKQKVRSKITASKAKWIDGKWKFYNCIIYQFPEETVLRPKSLPAGSLTEPGDVFTKKQKSRKLPAQVMPDSLPNGQESTTLAEPSVFKEIVLDIEEKPDDFLRLEDRADFMNYRQLKNYIRRLSGAGGMTARKLKVDLYYKISFPFISFIIMLIGIPFALVSRRGGALFGVGICLGISLSYYGVSAVSLALGKGGILPSFISAWLANILFGGLGIALIRKMAQ